MQVYYCQNLLEKNIKEVQKFYGLAECSFTLNLNELKLWLFHHRMPLAIGILHFRQSLHSLEGIFVVNVVNVVVVVNVVSTLNLR